MCFKIPSSGGALDLTVLWDLPGMGTITEIAAQIAQCKSDKNLTSTDVESFSLNRRKNFDELAGERFHMTKISGNPDVVGSLPNSRIEPEFPVKHEENLKSRMAAPQSQKRSNLDGAKWTELAG